MKKILAMFVIGCMAMVMASCSSNSPKGVAKQAVECLKQKDFKGYVDLLDIADGKQDLKEGYVQMLESKTAKQPQAVDIESYEVVGEQVDEKNGTATVTMKLVDSKGKEKEQRINLVRNGKGEWKIEHKK